jgi:hypothetical protein
MRKQALSVSASLDTLRRFVRPDVESVIMPLQSRDLLPSGKQIFALNLSYELNYTETTKLTPRFPRFELFDFSINYSSLCYDSAQESFSCMIVDENGRVLYYANQDAQKPVSLEYGKYFIKAQIMSSDVEMLERARGMLVCLETPLAKAVSLNCYASLGDVASSKTSTFKQTKLTRNAQVSDCFVNV